MLEPGALAPDFTLKDQAGQPVSLSSFRDDRDVLLVFFPLAFTAICQGELAQIQENLAGYQSAGVQPLAISVGPPPTHRVWATQNGFTFPVLSDFWPHGEVASAYGVLNDVSGYPNRGTFAVDRGGVVRFAEMRSPGELRDQAVWTEALAALSGT
jgi:peroxiredoxin (alkyl hydroperoxide reductase subunit C)